jgi:hypothetical protein
MSNISRASVLLLRPIERYVAFGPRQEPAGLVARLGVAGLQPDRSVIVFTKMTRVDHPADQPAQSRQQIAGL